MSIYQTPLQFGYFFGLLFSCLIFYRGFRKENQSDLLLALILFCITMEIQDYTFGFSGINILWENFNGFPRDFHLLLGPTVYLYVRSRTPLMPLTKKEFFHYLPYMIYFFFHLCIFIGGPACVLEYQRSDLYFLVSNIERFLVMVSYLLYFGLSYGLISRYESIIENQYSNTAKHSLLWLKHLLILIVSGEILRILFKIADVAYDLSFYQDWWWHLWTVAIIIFLSLRAYKQNAVEVPLIKFPTTPTAAFPMKHLEKQLLEAFEKDKIFLDAELNLSQLARLLHSNTSAVSSCINSTFKMNFNDFVNSYRVQEFHKKRDDEAFKNLTQWAVAQDCGFNSKSTFLRSVKKFDALPRA